jgi:LmbE family N-acetylglucosaminyl deacetylase
MVSLARQKDLLFVPELMRRPEGNKVLVFSPHCDDDVIGLGGSMHLHAAEGHQVTVVYFTAPASGRNRSSRAEIRREEARRATALLGEFQLIFLDRPEGNLKPAGPLLGRISGILRDTSPDVLYLPWFLDNHADHLAVNELLVRASSHCRPACMVYAYEVWTPLLPNRLLDITGQAALKGKALGEYASQLAEGNLVETILALNRYRSLTHGKRVGYAEAFLRVGLGEYVRLVSACREPSILRGALESKCLF